METAILFEAERLLSEQGVTGSGGAADPLYVLAHEDWHPGVIGIVASRLVDRYHRPFVMVAMSASGDGRGSGRSIRPYDLHAGLAASADHLEGFGGHRMAAGLQVRAERLDGFRAALVGHARGCLTPGDLVKVEHVDAVVPGDALGLDLAEELQALRPFGMGNPAINVLVPAAKVVRRAADGRRSPRALLPSPPAGCGRARSDSASPRAAATLGKGDTRHDLAARLEANEWQGAVEPRLVVRSLHPVAEQRGVRQSGGCAILQLPHGRRRVVERGSGPPTSRPRPHALPNCRLAEPRTVDRPPQQRRPRPARRPHDDRASRCWSCAPTSHAAPRCWSRDLDASRFARRPWARLSAHCASAAAADAADLVLADHGGLAATPAAGGAVRARVRARPAGLGGRRTRCWSTAARDSCTSGWGPAEVEFTRAVVEHQHGLRPHLTDDLPALGAAGPAGPRFRARRSRATGAIRAPAALAGRCMRVLAELDLARFQGSSGTVSCTITKGKRVELERSETFRACSAAGEEGLRYLSSLTPRAPSARAA